MIDTDIVFSINVHNNKDFLIKQIKNISDFVSLNYIVIINANNYMYNEILNCPFIKSNNNIVLNNDYLDKKRFHGSLTKGIYLNMKYAMKNYNFKYFVILSSRNLFYNRITTNDLDNLPYIQTYGWGRKDSVGVKFCNLDTSIWHWHSFIQTKLGEYIIANDLLFSSSAHEGLTFNYLSCEKLIFFLDNNDTIKENLFNWNHCVEEFALQTICINLIGNYFYIGNGVSTHYDSSKLPKNKYVYKTIRDDANDLH